MMTELKLVRLHTEIFLAGTNLGTKLDPSLRHGLRLVWDGEERLLLVLWKEEVAMVVEANVAAMIPRDMSEIKARVFDFAEKEPITPAAVVEAPTPQPQVIAQVETPQSHVFAGLGKGKSR